MQTETNYTMLTNCMYACVDFFGTFLSNVDVIQCALQIGIVL